MKKIKIKNYFLSYIFILILFTVFYLFTKHLVANDSSISEWLINYQGGFTRRGLGGEMAIFLSEFLNIALRKSILSLQLLFHVSYLIIIYLYFKDLKLNLLQTFALFSPIFLLYPIAEIEVLGRKEMVLFLFFLCAIIFSEKRFSSKFLDFQILFILPLVILIWEEIVIFCPFLAALLISKNNLNTFQKAFIKCFIIFLPSIIIFFYAFLNPLSWVGHKIMTNFLEKEFSEQCYMSCQLLILNTIYFDTWHFVHKSATIEHYFRYIMIFLIGFLPLNILLFQNKFNNKNNFISKNFKLSTIFFIFYSPSLLLFAFGYDWGRWVNITYTFSILYYFYLLKNNLITNYLNISSKKYFLINRKKTITIFVFFIFAFCWNPKTVITGDIASFPFYRVPYKAIKILND